MKCSTCRFVFHLDCLEMQVDAVPEADWQCAYCIKEDDSISRRERRVAQDQWDYMMMTIHGLYQF